MNKGRLNKAAAEQRLAEIAVEVKRLNKNPNLSDKMSAHLDSLLDEGETLMSDIETHQKAVSMGSFASPAEYGMSNVNPGEHDNPFAPHTHWMPGTQLKSFGAPKAPVVATPSPMHLDGPQLEALRQAAVNKAPFSVTIGQKGFEHTIRTKTAFTEGGIVTNPLPVTQLGGAYGHLGLPYETFRVLSALPAVQMDGPGISYLRHNSNTAEAAYVAEAGLKPSIGPVIEDIYIRASKVAATVEATREVLTDHDAFANFLPMELTRSVINEESSLLLNATHSSQGFDGLLNVSGIGSITINDGETPLDAIRRGMTTLRTGAAFATADLAICSPNTLTLLQTQKDLQDRYLLDVYRSAGGIDGTTEDERLWNVPVRQTTQIADNLVLLISKQAGGGYVYIREALNVTFNPYYDTSHNEYQWICEERIALAVPRPAAVVKVDIASS